MNTELLAYIFNKLECRKPLYFIKVFKIDLEETICMDIKIRNQRSWNSYKLSINISTLFCYKLNNKILVFSLSL